MTIKVEVKNVGNTMITYNGSLTVTLPDSKILSINWTMRPLNSGVKEELTYGFTTTDRPGGLYTAKMNVTIVEEDYNITNNDASLEFWVIYPPVLNFTYYPQPVYVGDTVTFNASASYHPNGTITKYTWKIYKGTLLVATQSFDQTTIMSYTFNEVALWKVVLEVTDNFNVTYKSGRDKTESYRLQMSLAVVEKPWSIDFSIIVIAIILIVVVVVGAALYMRRKRKKVEAETPT